MAGLYSPDYYVEKEYAPYAKLVFRAHTPAMIRFYSNLLKYDFPSLNTAR